MPRPSTPQHQRYNVRTGGRRTTVSLDYWLAGLLAVRLGEEPGGAKAAKRVGLWLQGWADKDAREAGLNRRLIRRAVLEVADKELSKRCAAWLDEEGGGAGTVQREAGRTTRRSGTVGPGRFVLYRASRGVPPDIVVRGTSVEDVRERAGEIYAEDDARSVVIRAALITTEAERHGEYYIRRCSEEFWAALKERRDIRPVVDSEGVWLTHKERARIKKARAWLDAVRSWARKGRRNE